MIVESLTPINDAELLKAVKASGNLTGDYQDATIQFYVDETKNYLISAGISAEVVGSTLATGCIARGVWDLWHPIPGEGKFSAYFYERAEQLRGIKVASV